jgi:hypothetical protein
MQRDKIDMEKISADLMNQLEVNLNTAYRVNKLCKDEKIIKKLKKYESFHKLMLFLNLGKITMHELAMTSYLNHRLDAIQTYYSLIEEVEEKERIK